MPQGSAEKLLAISNDIGDFAEQPSGALQLACAPLRLRECIENAEMRVAPGAYARHVELVSLVYDDVPDALLGDPERLSQLVGMLMDYAVGLTEYGDVVLRVMLDEDKADRVKLSFAITNSERRFGNAEGSTVPFPPHSPPGRDAQLASCRRLATAMDGDMSVSPADAQDLVVHATVRLAIDPHEPAPAEPQFGGRRVLLHDPHPLARLALRHLLESEGCLVVELADVPETRAALPVYPEIAVLGSHGDAGDLSEIRRWLDVLKDMAPMPVLVLINSSDPDLHAAVDEYGTAVSLSRPIPRGELMQALRRSFERPCGGPLPMRDSERALQIAGGRPEIARQMLARLIADLPHSLQMLREAQAAGDRQRLRHLKHRLQGAAAICSLPGLVAALQVLERAITADAPSELAAALAAVEYEAQRLIASKAGEQRPADQAG